MDSPPFHTRNLLVLKSYSLSGGQNPKIEYDLGVGTGTCTGTARHGTTVKGYGTRRRYRGTLPLLKINHKVTKKLEEIELVAFFHPTWCKSKSPKTLERDKPTR